MTRRVLAVPLLLAGCISTGSNVSSTDIHPVEVAVASAAELGFVSSLAMQAMATTSVSVPCTQVTQACPNSECTNGSVTITFGPECPLPIGGTATGTVTVSGSWTSSTSANLSTTFTNVQVGGTDSVVASATNLTVSSGEVTYTGQNVNVHGATVLAAQSSWTVTTGSDGSVTVSGTDQSVGGAADTSQISVSGVVISSSCTSNPTAGTATIQSVDGLHITQANIDFNSACDGKADVDGSSVALDFTAS